MTTQSARALGSRYELLNEIGRGATSIVWRGRIKATGEDVAVKILRPELASDQQLIARFTTERAALIAVEHPHLVRVRDLVVDGDSLALVFDYVEGPTLRARLEKGALAVSEATTIARSLAYALSMLHASDLVHCDVKPGNVLVASDGHVRLADLGLAWLLRPEKAGVDSVHRPTIRAASAQGTPGYLAPEVALGASPTPASDVYSLGVVLYEMLTGRTAGAVAVPRRPGTRLPISPAGLEQAPDHPRPAVGPARIPDVPRDLWRVVGLCLRSDPSGRPTAAELAGLLAGERLHAGRTKQPAAEAPTVSHVEAVRPDGDGASAATSAAGGLASAGVKGEWSDARRIAVGWVGLIALTGAAIGCVAVLATRPSQTPAAAPVAESAIGTRSSTPADRSELPDGGHREHAAARGAGQPVPHGGDGDTDSAIVGEYAGRSQLETYVAPTGWLCRPPATVVYGRSSLHVQVCIAVGRTTVHAEIRPTLSGSAPDRPFVDASLQLMRTDRRPDVVGIRRCALPSSAGACPTVTADVAQNSAYRATVTLQVRGSSEKSATFSTPIVHNNQPQDRKDSQSSVGGQE